jgi:uncharacterized repeat protein (TIGR03803 family)
MTSQLQHLNGIWAKCPGMATATRWLTVVLVAGVLAAPSIQGQTYTVLYNFTGTAGDGAFPRAGLALDAKGNLYGATENGGTGPCVESFHHDGCGTVFMIDTTGKETILYSFPKHLPDGQYPDAGVLRDAAGNLYGTTSAGGKLDKGTVFELRSGGKEFVFGFPNAADGTVPNGLVRGAAGNLYGTTASGGDLTCNSQNGCGTVFKLDATGVETVLYSFTGGTDGAVPSGATPGGLVIDSTGNLYGTTSQGGDPSCVVNGPGCGTVFGLDTTSKETVLHVFTGYPKDGAIPSGGLLRDQLGDLFGTTAAGGTHGYGTVFKLNANAKESILYNFTGRADGEYPDAGVLRDSASNIYGTTAAGGDHTCSVPNSSGRGCGVLFKLALDGTETVLHTFTGAPADGARPQGLIHDSAGNLYGTTYYGGANGFGTVFKITP